MSYPIAVAHRKLAFCLRSWPILRTLTDRYHMLPLNLGYGRFYGATTHPILFDTDWASEMGVTLFLGSPKVPQSFAALGIVRTIGWETVSVLIREGNRRFWFSERHMSNWVIVPPPATPVEVQLDAAFRRWKAGYHAVALMSPAGAWYNPVWKHLEYDFDLFPTLRRQRPREK